MRVTDEMVFAAADSYYAAKDDASHEDAIRAALEAALSHAAGQDGEQCRVASGDADLGTWLWGKLMDFCQKRRMPPAEYNDLFKIVDELRALSRGVPEGVIPEGWTLVPKVPTQQMIDCGNDVADWGYYYSSECPRHASDGEAHEVYHAMLLAAPLVPAIAAQRKEGA